MEPCTIGRRGEVALITLRAPCGNALTAALVRALEAALERADRSAARAVVLTGKGAAFCVGLDLFQHHRASRATVAAFVRAYSRLLRRLFALEQQLVIALNGHAYAGGAVLLLTGDYRIAARDARTRVAFGGVALGLPLPRVPALVVRLALADHAQRRLLLTGEAVALERAIELGLIDETVPARSPARRGTRARPRARALPDRLPHRQARPAPRDAARMDARRCARATSSSSARGAAATQTAIGNVRARLLAKKGR
ncbi:MAG: enoyl-CoA hydratase/isomerase family protein [Planctomycetota bacterium]